MFSCKPVHLYAGDASRTLLTPRDGSGGQKTEVGAWEGCQEEVDTIFLGGWAAPGGYALHILDMAPWSWLPPKSETRESSLGPPH